jgi:transcriptional regulator with XRE-family HTH domain
MGMSNLCNFDLSDPEGCRPPTPDGGVALALHCYCSTPSSLICERSPILISVRMGRWWFVHDVINLRTACGGYFMKMRGKRVPTPVDVRFGHKMRERRKMLRMSQTELAAALGVTFQQIQKYENGFNSVKASALEKLAGALRVPITYFFDGHPSEKRQTDGSGMDLSVFLATPEGFALCSAFQHIESEGMRSAVIDLLQGLQGMATEH